MRIAVTLAALAALTACDDGSETGNSAAINAMTNRGPPAETEASGMAVAPYGNGVVTLKSDKSVDQVLERLAAALKEGGYDMVVRHNHQEKAEGVGLDLPSASVMFFGKPDVGTFLMQESPEAALDLPQRMAVYADKDGSTVIAYNDPVWLASRHGITGQKDRIATMSRGLEALAKAASGNDEGEKDAAVDGGEAN